MSDIFFNPWIGERYGTEKSFFSKKILIIGDSHYCEDHCGNCGNAENKTKCSSFTTNVVLDYLNNTNSATWHRTFTKFMNSFVPDKYI